MALPFVAVNNSWKANLDFSLLNGWTMFSVLRLTFIPVLKFASQLDRSLLFLSEMTSSILMVARGAHLEGVLTLWSIIMTVQKSLIRCFPLL